MKGRITVLDVRFSDGSSYLFYRAVEVSGSEVYIRMAYDAEGKGIETGKTSKLQILKHVADAMGLKAGKNLLDTGVLFLDSVHATINDEGLALKRVSGPRKQQHRSLPAPDILLRGTFNFKESGEAAMA